MTGRDEGRSGRSMIVASPGRRASRRDFVRWSAALGVGGVFGARLPRGLVAQGTPTGALMDEVAIDLAVEPPTLDPAMVYDADGWSIVHSVYDALVQYGPSGELEPLLAESLALVDPLTYEATLRQGVRFHNGEAFDARSVAVSVRHVLSPDSQVVDNFSRIQGVEEIDPFTVRFKLSEPAPWLPAQMAAWLVMLPPDYASDPANGFATSPVGTGPYVFEGWERGSRIELTANPNYFAGSVKGRSIAERVTYRFVPEANTRVADLLNGTAGLVRGVPVDQVAAVEEGGGIVRAEPIAGAAFVRIATDVAPFDDVRVRRALNHAIDVDTIVQALLGGNGQRLANLFVPRGLGFDPGLAPYAYDPDRARALLAEANLAQGFEATLAYATSEREDIVTAIAGQLGEIGIRVEVQAVEPATFNGTWADPTVAPLRFVTWRPLFDPFTLLSLVFSNAGPLSRHDNPNVQRLIDAGAGETDEAARAEIYRELGRVLHEEPAAIYLYDLTALYGIDDAVAAAWTPRPDDYIIATTR